LSVDVGINLTKYLRDEFPGEVFYWEQLDNTALQTTPPDRCAKVLGTGGPSACPLKYTQAKFQILVRDIDRVAAAKFAKNIYDLLHGRFGLIFPAALNVGGDNYAEVQTAEIKAVQLPYCIGMDDAGRTSYTTNYTIIYEEA